MLQTALKELLSQTGMDDWKLQIKQLKYSIYNVIICATFHLN